MEPKFQYKLKEMTETELFAKPGLKRNRTFSFHTEPNRTRGTHENLGNLVNHTVALCIRSLDRTHLKFEHR